MEKKIWFKDKRGSKICGTLSMPEGKGPFPAVVLAPGLTSNKERPTYVGLSKLLFDIKIVALPIDLYGHGESDGKLEDITITSGAESISAAIDFLSTLPKINKNKIGIFGASYGGSASISAASSDSRIKVVVFKCPASDYKEVRILQLTEKGIKDWEKNDGATIENKFYLKWSFYKDVLDNHLNQYAEAEQIKVPTLIIHGSADTTVPLHQSKQLLESLSGIKRLEIIEGANHQFDKPTGAVEKVIKLAADWFNKYLK